MIKYKLKNFLDIGELVVVLDFPDSHYCPELSHFISEDTIGFAGNVEYIYQWQTF